MHQFAMGIVTLWTPDIYHWALPIAEGKRIYSEKWGLGFHSYEDTLDVSRNPTWSKILALQRNFNLYDWLLWVDADAIITNHAIDLRSLCDNNYDLIVTHDQNGMNAGVFLIRCNEESLRFLQNVWDKNESIPYQDQTSINLVIAETPMLRVKVIEKRLLNSYWCDYERGDFILHAAGEPEETRKRMLRIAIKMSSPD